MAIVKHRPRVRVIAPPLLVPGSRVALRVEVECRSELDVTAIDATISGKEAWRRGSGSYVRSESRPVGRWHARLSQSVTLPAGTSSFRMVFELPPDAPPSYCSSATTVAYHVEVTVDIPWWPDARRSFLLTVGLPAAAIEGHARVVSTAPGGPSGKEPHIECSVVSDAVAAGEKLRGAVSLQNVAWNRYRGLEVSLVGTERVSGGRRKEDPAKVFGYRYELDIGSPVEGKRIPFALELPKQIAPTFTSQLWSLSWQLEVVAPCGWTGTARLRVPVHVAPTGSQAAARPGRQAPRVGSERMAAVWAAVGARHGLSLSGEAELGTRIGDVGVAVCSEHRGGAGLFVVAELRYPPLGLGLRGGPQSAVRRLFGTGMRIEGRPSQTYLEGRELEQVRRFIEPIEPLLAQTSVAQIADDELRVERRGGALDERALEAFVKLALDLARALRLARAAIPPPAVMAMARPAWEALAHELDGSLETARMAVVGRYEEREARVVTEWRAAGAPEHTLVELAAEPPLSEQHCLRFVRGEGWEPPLAALPPRARALLAHAEAKLVGASLTSERLTLVLPAPLLAPAPEIRPHFALLSKLSSELAAARAGPYR